MPKIAKTHTVLDTEAGRIDRVVAQLTGLSRAQVRGLLNAGAVQLNDHACSEDFTRVAPGDRIAIAYDDSRGYRDLPRPSLPPGVRLVHEDEQLLVVDKPANLLTVPTDRGEKRTLIRFLYEYVNRGRMPFGHMLTIVHRLDRDTSGLLVFAKDRATGLALQAQFAGHQPEREYVAIVAGRVEPATGTFRSRLITGKNLTRRSTHRTDEGEPAVTHYRVERAGADATVVRVTLETGQRNQIRVHFAEAGHPVLGDERYKPDLARHTRWRAARVALHATVLGFVHPKSEKPLRFESPLPPEFGRFLAGWRGA